MHWAKCPHVCQVAWSALSGERDLIEDEVVMTASGCWGDHGGRMRSGQARPVLRRMKAAARRSAPPSNATLPGSGTISRLKSPLK